VERQQYSGDRSKHYAHGNRRLQTGTVSVNCYSEGDITIPLGWRRLSGFGGKENFLMAHKIYT